MIIYTVILVRTCYSITISENVTLYTTTLEAQYFIYSLATYEENLNGIAEGANDGAFFGGIYSHTSLLYFIFKRISLNFS